MTLSISSCVVLHEEYFFPQAIGGKVQGKGCGHAGADSQLIFTFEDVDVKMEVWEYQNITRLGITFKIHSKSKLVWPQQPLFVTANKFQTNIEVKGFDRFVRKGNDIATETYFVDSIMKKNNNLNHETFHESFIVSKESVNALEVSTFYLIINGKKEQIPPSVFSKESGLFLHPLNC